MKAINILIKVVLFVVIIVLAYYIVVGIQKPIKFEDQRVSRFNKNIAKLKDIRTAQNAFREANGYFTPSFDTLIDFINTGDIKVIRAIGFVPDTLTELQAVERGIVSRDTFLVPIKDSLFKHVKYPIEKIRYNSSGNIVEWNMDTASVLTGSNVVVKVFSAYADIRDILDGLDKQLIVNYIALKPEGTLRVGSLTEADNSAGNWE
jgi:hypothetical protein